MLSDLKSHEEVCYDLFHSEDDWLQAITTHVLSNNESDGIKLNEFDWHRLEPNAIADNIVELRRVKNNSLIQNLESYIHNRENKDMYSILEKILTLKKIDLFGEIPNKVLYHVSQITEEVEYMIGESIFKDGDYGDYMLVIAKGNVKIHKDEKVITELGEGACFGEMAILDGEPRSADATALSDCIMFKISQRDFSQVLSSQQEIMNGIILTLTKRLRETTQKLYVDQ
jgi:hypothetical protein